jgi:hypothetical protein
MCRSEDFRRGAQVADGVLVRHVAEKRGDAERRA